LSDGVAAGRGKEFDTLMQLRAITKHWIVRQWPEHPVTGRIPAGPAIPPWANDRDTGGASRPPSHTTVRRVRIRRFEKLR
jgi:hypothetical protein